VCSLLAAVTILRVATLVPDNQDADLGLVAPVDDRVGEVCQRVELPTMRRRSTKVRMLLQQLGDPFELGKESPCKPDSSFSLVEPNCVGEVFRSRSVDGPIH
jgi:hypothetical protein